MPQVSLRQTRLCIKIKRRAPRVSDQRDFAFYGAERESKFVRRFLARISREATKCDLPQEVVFQRSEESLQLVIQLDEQFRGRLGTRNRVESLVGGIRIVVHREDRISAHYAATSFLPLMMPSLVEHLVFGEVSQQLGEIFAAQVVTKASFCDAATQLVEDRKSDIFFVGGSATVWAELFASFADECLTTETP